MRRVIVVLGLAVMGCDKTPTSASPNPRESVGAGAHVKVAPAGAGANAAPPERPAISSEYYTTADLGRLGLRVTPAGDGEALVCGSEADSQCLCLMRLDCDSGGCIDFSENVTAFRSALSHPAPGTTVQCDKAEVGECDAFKYFEFQGDLYRREMRWFDASGVLVGQRDVTDYPAYCGKQTRARFIGRIPKCTTIVSRQLICGEGSPTTSPLDDLRRFTGPSAKPTGAARQ